MIIKQFEDQQSGRHAYAVFSECQSEIILIDPSDDLTPYLQYAADHQARIIGAIATALPAARSLLLQDIPLYCSGSSDTALSHQPFDDGAEIVFGKIQLKARNTPGHTPDSLSIVLTHAGVDKAVFTGSTLWAGDCGRPTLSNDDMNTGAAQEVLARQLYHSLRDKLMVMDDAILIYPGRGAGSTIGTEKSSNWSLQPMTEDEFVIKLMSGQA